MLGLSSLCRRLDDSPAAFLIRAERLGFAGIALDANLDGRALATLLPAIHLSGLHTLAIESPCPRPPGRRPPRLASDDREERLAAVGNLETTMRTAAELSARIVVVRLGPLPVQHEFSVTARAFARRTLTEEQVDRLVELRRTISPRAFDLARFGLDGALNRAQAAGLTLAITNAGRWYELPSGLEMAALLDDFRGAPLAPWYDPARAQARMALGFGRGRPAIEIGQAAGAWLTDAAGLADNLPWGTGEVDHEAVRSGLPKDALRILRSSIATDEELRTAMGQA